MISRRSILLATPAIVLASHLGWASDGPRHDWSVSRELEGLLVRMKPGYRIQDCGDGLNHHRAQVVRHFDLEGLYYLKLPKGHDAREYVEELESCEFVAEVLPNEKGRSLSTPNDPYYGATSGPQTYLNTINCPAAWSTLQLASLGSMPPLIDVDTGAPANNDVTANILTGFDATGTGITDTDGHGTRVGGIGAAVTNNSLGIASVGWGGTITPTKTDFTTVNNLSCLSWIAGNIAAPAVVNMSFQGAQNSLNNSLLALWNAGLFLVAAAGDTLQTTCVAGPCDSPYVLGVALVNDSLAATSITSYGPASNGQGAGALVSAPGGATGDAFCTTDLANAYTCTRIGSSFSSMMVAAAARYLWAANASLKNFDLWYLLAQAGLGQAVSGFTGVSAPYSNPQCIDMNAMLNAALTYRGAPFGGKSLLGRR